MSIESKLDIFGTFYKDFISIKSLESKTKKNTDHKFVILDNATNKYYKLIKEYKNVYKREPMVWSKNMTLKIWKL